MTQAQVDADIEELYQTMKNYIEQEQLSTQISITKGSGYVFVSFDNTVFFDGDSYVLRDDGKTVLDQVAKAIADVSESIDEIRVLGHTAQDDPDSPNNPRNDRFLATNRAAVVTVYLQEKTSSIRPGWSAWATDSGAPWRTTTRRRDAPKTGVWNCW